MLVVESQYPWSVRPNGQPWSEPYDPYYNDGIHRDRGRVYYHDHRRDWSHRSNGTPWSVRPNGQPWSEPYDPYYNDGIHHPPRYDRGGGSEDDDFESDIVKQA